MEVAITLNAEWIWLMDDDTISTPDTLHILTEKLSLIDKPIGFIGSKCIWKNGEPHLMNVPAINHNFNNTIPFNKYDDRRLLLVETNSFVSILINSEVVKKVSLPYKEFFIWGNDQEYTRRITKAGFLCFYCMDSIVLHKMPINYCPDFYCDSVHNLWKYSHGFRNEFFIINKNNEIFYFIFWLIAKLLYTSLQIIKIRRATV